MQSYKLIPQFRENCVIEGKEEWLSEFSKGDVIFLISTSPIKKISIISKIEDIVYQEEPIIYIDKRIMEGLGPNDRVHILKYNPAEALEVQISISDEYQIITKGEWTSTIKSSLLNKLVDLGQEITFLIPWEGGAPIVITGIIHSTLPNPPIYIGERTRLFLNKISSNDLFSAKKGMANLKSTRVNILEEQIKTDIVQKIREIKHKNYPNRGIKYSFKATNPKHLFKVVSNIFKGFEIIEEANENEFESENQDYLASAVFLLDEPSHSFQLIDIEVIAMESSGILILWVTAKTESLISQIIEKYDSIIKQLKQGLEQKVEILNINCPECGGALPIMDININGVVECKYCGKRSKIPKLLRY
jgi:hypothetical protein